MIFFSNLKPNLFIAISSIYGLLMIAELVLFGIKTKYKNSDFSELRARIRSWWIMVTIFTVALTINRTLSLIFLGIVSFLALKEYFSIIPTRRADRRVILLAYLTIPLQYYFAAIGWYGMFVIFIPVYMFIIIPCRMILVGETKNFLHATGTIHWGVMTTVYCLSHASYLLSMQISNLPAGNAGLLFYLVLLTQLNDVAQYVWGKLFGVHKIVPRISPGKTRIGLVGGLLTTAVTGALIAPWLTPFNMLNGLALSIIMGICGFVGDVSISAVKRDIGVKDMGNLIPGHGGVLDRVDSLTFTAPIFFHTVNYFYAS